MVSREQCTLALACFCLLLCAREVSSAASLRQFYIDGPPDDLQTSFELGVHRDDSLLDSGERTVADDDRDDVTPYFWGNIFESNEAADIFESDNLFRGEATGIQAESESSHLNKKTRKPFMHKDLFVAPEERDAGASFFYSMPLGMGAARLGIGHTHDFGLLLCAKVRC